MDYQLTINNTHTGYCYIHAEEFKSQLIICTNEELFSSDDTIVDLEETPLAIAWYKQFILCFGYNTLCFFSPNGRRIGRWNSPNFKVMDVIYFSSLEKEYIYYTSIEPFVIRFMKVTKEKECLIAIYSIDSKKLDVLEEGILHKKIIESTAYDIYKCSTKGIIDCMGDKSLYIKRKAFTSELWDGEKCIICEFGYIDRAVLLNDKIVYTISSLEKENTICKYIMKKA